VDLNFHGTDDQLEEYVFGRLSVSDLPALEEHLMICGACRDRLDAMEAVTAGLKEALGTNPALLKPAPSWAEWFARFAQERLRQPAFFMAVGLVALVAVVAVLSNGHTKFAPAATLQLTASRGEMPSAVPARELDLTLSDVPPEGGPFRVEIVNATGHAMWSGAAASSGAGIQVKAERQFGSGDYFVRLYSVSGNMLREYGFRIRPLN
jgi:anti-sigma factor RsiW